MPTLVPDNIIAAVNALLAPYGETFSQNRPASGGGYLSMKDSAKYLGVSRAFFYRLVAAGKIQRIKLSPGQRGKTVYSKASLDAYVASR